jgi:hypothetical protein
MGPLRHGPRLDARAASGPGRLLAPGEAAPPGAWPGLASSAPPSRPPCRGSPGRPRSGGGLQEAGTGVGPEPAGPRASKRRGCSSRLGGPGCRGGEGGGRRATARAFHSPLAKRGPFREERVTIFKRGRCPAWMTPAYNGGPLLPLLAEPGPLAQPCPARLSRPHGKPPRLGQSSAAWPWQHRLSMAWHPPIQRRLAYTADWRCLPALEAKQPVECMPIETRPASVLLVLSSASTVLLVPCC